MGVRVELPDPAFCISLHQVGIVRVIVGVDEQDRVGVVAFLAIQHSLQVDLHEAVAVENQESILETIKG